MEKKNALERIRMKFHVYLAINSVDNFPLVKIILITYAKSLASMITTNLNVDRKDVKMLNPINVMAKCSKGICV
jgi:hypothetical protein